MDEDQQQSSGPTKDSDRDPPVDLTEAQLAEILAERERLLRELETSRHLFQQIAETIPDVLYVYDLDTGRTIYMGARSEQTKGYTAEEVQELGDRFAVTHWHPDDLPSLPEHRRKLRELADGELYECEYRILQPDGAYRWLRTRSSVFARAADERVQQIVGVTQDITARRQADEELLALKNSLAADLSAMTRLHELGARLLATSELLPSLQDALAATIAFQGADFGNIQLLNRQTGALEIYVQQGFDQPFLDYFRSVGDDHSSCDRALKSGKRVIIEDVELDPDFAPHRAIAAATGLRTVQSTPLLDRAGTVLGVFSTHFRRVHRFTEHELRLTDLYTRQVAEMIVFKLAENRSRRAHDELETQVLEHTGQLAERNERLRTEIAERKRAEAELRKLASLVENSMDFVGIALAEGQLLFVNPAGQALLGLEGDEQVRTTVIFDYVAQQDQGRLRDQVLPAVFRDGHWEGETLFRHFKTGALIPMWQHIFFITEQESHRRIAIGTISRDITERRRAERARHALLQQLVDAQEEERRRLARELHDSLGQHLTALHLGLQRVQRQDGCPPEVADGIEKLRELALRIDEAVDHLSFELRPPALDDLGLADGLHRLVKEWSAMSHIPVDLHMRGLDHERLPALVETSVYRVVQEALTNILKHAQATRVSLIVERHTREVLAIIEDDGRGFDPAALPPKPGARRQLGITGMQERAALADGRLDIESVPGAGTTVYLHVPLATDPGSGGGERNG